MRILLKTIGVITGIGITAAVTFTMLALLMKLGFLIFGVLEVFPSACL